MRHAKNCGRSSVRMCSNASEEPTTRCASCHALSCDAAVANGAMVPRLARKRHVVRASRREHSPLMRHHATRGGLGTARVGPPHSVGLCRGILCCRSAAAGPDRWRRWEVRTASCSPTPSAHGGAGRSGRAKGVVLSTVPRRTPGRRSCCPPSSRTQTPGRWRRLRCSG